MDFSSKLKVEEEGAVGEAVVEEVVEEVGCQWRPSLPS